MKKLIELDAALEGLENLNAVSFYEANEHSKEAYLETKDMLKALPTVDAVEVVRCKDCRHWRGRKYNVHINGFLPWCGFSALQREANDFCSYGERKDSDHHD